MTNIMKKDLSYLSKSLFIKGLQCPKSLYLFKTQPELRGEISESQEAIFSQGTEVGIVAQGLFLGGKEIPYEGLSHDEQLKLTQAEIDRGTAILYEPVFTFDKIFIKADILQKNRKGWDLFEVKATTKIKDKEVYKDVYIDDIALQYYVLQKSGLPIRKAFLVFINNQYVKNGDLDLNQLFLKEDVTKKALEKQGYVRKEIKKLRKALAGDTPSIDIGEHCDDPYPCDFKEYCWQHLPDYSVLNLSRRNAKLWDLYRQGIFHLKEIPLEVLNKSQKFEVKAFLNRRKFADPEKIKNFLDTLWEPIYFLDFETFQTAIPLYDGIKPYQQIPFQYSIHFFKGSKSKPGHYEFLASPNMDPRKELVETLLERIPREACILAYHASFEKTILEQLAERFPKYQTKLKKMIDNLLDLEVPFRKKALYHWSMKGSSSLKKVLPALIPELDYDELEICDGGMAAEAYFKMCRTQDPKEAKQIRKNLLEYCRMDTLAMVELLRVLSKKSSLPG